MPTVKEYEDFLKYCLTEKKSDKIINLSDVPSKPSTQFPGFNITQIKPSADMCPGDEDDGIMGDDTSINIFD